MNRLATALALVAMTTGSLVATEGVSFAGTRHGKRPVAQKIVSGKKMKKSHKGFEYDSLLTRRAPIRKKNVRRHRRTVKNPVSRPGTGSTESITG